MSKLLDPHQFTVVEWIVVVVGIIMGVLYILSYFQ